MLNLLRRLQQPAASEPDLSRHVPALDAIRGLAILVVTLYRFGGGSPGAATVGEKVIPFIDLGSRGVDLFFVLSGFLITGILFDAKAKPRFFLNFYARRTVRIFPLYYGILLLSLVLVPWLAGRVVLPEAQANSAWLWFYGANILQSIRGEWCLGWLNHFWSLAVEEHFYLVWPAVIYGLSLKNAKRACVVLFGVAMFGRVAWLLSGGNHVAPEVCTLFRLDGLAAGSWLALQARDGGLVKFVPPARLTLAVVTLLLIPITLRGMKVLTVVDSLWVIECCAFLVLVVTAAPHTFLARFGSSASLHWLGKYSYGMYVFGNLLIPLAATFCTASVLAAACGNLLLGQLAYLLVMSLATAGVALASWNLFEKHCLKLKKWF